MSNPKKLLLAAFILVALSASRLARAQEPTPAAETPTPSGPLFTANDLIDTINTLRMSSGIPPLSVHPVLMQIAQTEANGIAAGYGGHWRPNNLSLGQWLISLGYPLSGDLSMDGYRSENWFSADLSSTLNDVTQGWRGDTEHSDTMFSTERSDIGAALAVADDGQVYVVLETALRTTSGRMQSDAYPILTGIPATQLAYADLATQAAKNGLLPQYSMPIVLSTARPDGNIIHDVRYGQTLWGIAIAYHTTIKEIQSLNHMSSTVVYDGQKLLVRQGVTQSAPAVLPLETPPVLDALFVPSPAVSPVAAEPSPQPSSLNDRTTLLSFGTILATALFLAGVFAAMFRKKD